MAKNKRPLMTYNDIIEKYPNFIFGDAFTVFEEETPELTHQARLRRKARLGHLLKFMQDHGLTRKIICAVAPEIADDLVIYYRDLMPEALEFDRQAVSKWYRRFERNMHADPSDMRILEKWLTENRGEPKK